MSRDKSEHLWITKSKNNKALDEKQEEIIEDIELDLITRNTLAEMIASIVIKKYKLKG